MEERLKKIEENTEAIVAHVSKLRADVELISSLQEELTGAKEKNGVLHRKILSYVETVEFCKRMLGGEGELASQITEIVSRIDSIYLVVAALEWSGEGGACPVCHSYPLTEIGQAARESFGHDGDCELADFLGWWRGRRTLLRLNPPPDNAVSFDQKPEKR